MYFQPYGDEQQLNLNWIINEIINLHKQLDPDYETPSFTQVYPYSNLNRLNLDWVLSELKALKELAPEPTPQIDIEAVAEALVALPFDRDKPYQIFDYISRDGEIWRATEAIAAGSEWNSSQWYKTKLGTDLAVLERWINTINNSLTNLENTIEDLSSADISDDSNAGGATVKASLNNLKGSLDAVQNTVTDLSSADISDDSNAGGATVKASLNNLKGSLDTVQNTVTNLSSAGISDDSNAGGATVKASLNNLKGSLNTAESNISTLQTTINAQSIELPLIANSANIARANGRIVYSPITKTAIIYGRGDNYYDNAFHAIATGELFTLPNNIRPTGNTITAANILLMDDNVSNYQFEVNNAGQIVNNFSSNVKSFIFFGSFKYI